VLDVPIPAGQGERIAGVARPFIDSLKSGATMCSAEEGRLSVQLCLAAYEAAERGCRIPTPFHIASS
ncbi:MAG TPA: gfo/Idh/MocA family oxidoreductase, partial [Chthonomonadales bacterium]|nr:gfo/Idh/MocA family oxidoreductase [Chthonomonadales bacterium]